MPKNVRGNFVRAACIKPGEVLWKFDLSNISGAFVSVGPDGNIDYTCVSSPVSAV